MKLTRRQLRSLIKEAVLNESVDIIDKLITMIATGDPVNIRQAVLLAESVGYIDNVQENMGPRAENLGVQTMSVSFDADQQFGVAFRDAYLSDRDGFGGYYTAKIYNVSVPLPTTPNQRYQISFEFDAPYEE
tara:strand:- start:349 stop:744 length:396 start_codon:yes stop_codon:yes gene_type:complete